MPEIVKKIKVDNTRGWKGTSSKSIKGLLRDNGYSDKEIEHLKKNGKIAILPDNLGSYVKRNQQLVVLESVPDPEPNNQFSNRFKHLETD